MGTKEEKDPKRTRQDKATASSESESSRVSRASRKKSRVKKRWRARALWGRHSSCVVRGHLVSDANGITTTLKKRKVDCYLISPPDTISSARGPAQLL